MQNRELMFVGIRGSVVALDRGTGEQVWAVHLKGWDFVNVLVRGEIVYATTHGEVFCLHARTGDSLWHNRLKGFGTGLASMAFQGDTAGAASQAGQAITMAEERYREAQAASQST